MSSDKSHIIAVFDFDHTLTDRDSLFPFLFYCFPFWKVFLGFIILLPNFIAFLFNWQPRQYVKEKILTYFFSTMPIETLQQLSQSYADTKLDSFLKPEALACLKRHLAQKHRCILVSASIDVYLKPWAIRHGFEAVLASKLELTSQKIVTGKLLGKNCWGQEKKERLLAYLDPKEKYYLYMYGDSEGDRQLLELADVPCYRSFP